MSQRMQIRRGDTHPILWLAIKEDGSLSRGNEILDAANEVTIEVYNGVTPSQVTVLSATIDTEQEPGYNVYHEWTSEETMALTEGIYFGHVQIDGPGLSRHHVPTGSYFVFQVLGPGPQ